MARHKGSKNKHRKNELVVSKYSPEERIRIIANVIIDRILDDQNNGKEIYKLIHR